VVALGAAEGLVLRLPVRPVLELLGGILLELLDLPLGLLHLLLVLCLFLAHGAALPREAAGHATIVIRRHGQA
jgi:hypothetical protein